MRKVIFAAGLAVSLCFSASAAGMQLSSAPTYGDHHSGAGSSRHALVEGGAPGTGGGPSTGGGASSSSPARCSDSTYDLDAGFRVEGTFEYIFLAEKTPSGLNVTNTETAVKESVTNWTKAKNVISTDPEPRPR
ncbi:MAG: hypothetical protein H0U90_04825 [Actinobacteria bacterium]|nr:hypothetical protein [Actinomycetota bacterium]